MDAVFRVELNRVLHGNYEVTGYSSSHAMLAVDAGSGARRRQGTELHESVHSELSDMSTYGWFQQLLATVGPNSDRELRGRARTAFDSSMAAAVVTQEGLASLRELAWIAANETKDEVDAFLSGIPVFYRTGLDRALTMFGRPLIGDPSKRSYLGYSPPAFHVAVIALGLVIMNSPILVHYTDPNILLSDSDLPWISQSGPDQRFESLLEHQDAVSRMLFAVLQLATRKGKKILNVKVLRGVYDFAIEHVRQNITGFPLVTTAEHEAQARVLMSNWASYLNQRPGSYQLAYHQGAIDVGDDRALDMRYERRNQGAHEVNESKTIELDLASFVSAHQQENFADIFRLVIFSTLPSNPPDEFLLDCDVGLVSAPMWTLSEESSPFVKFRPVLYCQTQIRNLVRSSEDLSHAGCVWYSNLSLVRSIRRVGVSLQGLIVEKCDSPRFVLAVADLTETQHPSFATFRFGDEHVLAIISNDTFSFSLASELQLEAFAKRTGNHNLRRHNGNPLRLDRRDVAPNSLARAALWGFVGR